MRPKLDINPEPSDSRREESEPISLDALAAAFAEVMGKPPKPRGVKETDGGPSNLDSHDVRNGSNDSDHVLQPSSRLSSLDHAGLSFDDELAAQEDSGPVTPIGILEAMLFVGDRDGKPLTAAAAAELMRGVDPAEIDQLVTELNRRYETSGCPYKIDGNAGGYRLSLREEFDSLRQRFSGRAREAKLSQAAIDVLAVVAYQQPLTIDQIGTMRGKPCNHVLSQLVHRGLLRIERKPGKKRLAQYFTTDRFLQLFGLQTLADLPQSEELERS
jgi:segregation and condensation protein B